MKKNILKMTTGILAGMMVFGAAISASDGMIIERDIDRDEDFDLDWD